MGRLSKYNYYSQQKNIRKAKDSLKIKLLVDEWIKNKKYLGHEVGIEILGRDLGINRTYISNYINDTYNCNFNTWLHRMRVEDAKRIITEKPELSMGQVAIMTGYNDQAHFSKQFKYVMGISPMKWKKERMTKL